MDMLSLPYNFQSLRVTVMGLGRFGGGVAAARFLAERGARVTVTDLQSSEALAPSIAALNGCPIQAFHLGGHSKLHFLEADLVVANPAVPRNSEYLELARAARIPITSEMNLFWQFNRGQVIGVTGSNGKSTTTALIHSVLAASGAKAHLGGNIGGSLLGIVDQINEDDWVVLELSSFQLEDLNALPASPRVAVVTNFQPNHLDWHGCLADYRRAKQTILRWQTPQCVAVLNDDDPDVSRWTTYGRRIGFGNADTGRDGVFRLSDGRCIARINGAEATFPLADWLTLPGRHNIDNALAAAAACLAIGVDLAAIERGIKSFAPLPHRLQFVADVNGRSFYNDSLATTPESTVAALAAFTRPIVLLAGGYDKLVDLSPMAEAIADKAKAVALMGQTAELLESLIEDFDPDGSVPLEVSASLEQAFQWACAQSEQGDVVLLSPGCASYDWFVNFADRGQKFIELIQARQREGLP